MKAIRFEFIAMSMLVGWIATAAGTVTTLLGMPVVPADAPTVLVTEVVVHEQHARASFHGHEVFASLVDGL
jgi:hypothetical protein